MTRTPLICNNFVKKWNGKVDRRATIYGWNAPLLNGTEIPETHQKCGGNIRLHVELDPGYPMDEGACECSIKLHAVCSSCGMSLPEIAELDAEILIDDILNGRVVPNEEWLNELRRNYIQRWQDYFTRQVAAHVDAQWHPAYQMSEEDKEWYRNLISQIGLSG